MLFPIKHENMTARRWPVITLALIAINTLAFVATNSVTLQQQEAVEAAKHSMVAYATAHPELKLDDRAAEVVKNARRADPDLLKEFQLAPSTDTPAPDALFDGSEIRQVKMDKLVRAYEDAASNSILNTYGFVPAHPNPLSYITANFLHGGWLHLIGNMWFLWLAGFVLEDAWGRALYAVVYLAAGAAALEFYALASPGSLIPTIGASGAVAALMGAFLVRFPKMKIEMAFFFNLRPYRFKAPAYTLLPLWLLMEVFSGALFGSSSGVAHWAHVGGFLFGMVAAVALRYTGLEQKANKQIEEEISWQADPQIAQATELYEQQQYDAAAEVLKTYLAVSPESADGWNLLQQVYWRKSAIPEYYEALTALCAVYVKQRNLEAAWATYEDFLQAGGKQIPPATWLELCRFAESGQDLERALAEYEKLAAAFPAERQSVLAQIGAGRVCLKLQRATDALQRFEAAKASKVPHLDMDDNIEGGIREARSMLGAPAKAAAQPA